MSTYYFVQDLQGQHICDNFPTDLRNLVYQYKESKNAVEINLNGILVQARLGKKANAHGIVYILTTEIKYVNRFKLFKEFVDFSVLAIEPFVNFHRSIIQENNIKTEELIHNITSLNTYGIQDLFVLIPQKTLSENINKQKEIIKDFIKDKPQLTADTLLKLIKYNLAMKVEFSVFERTRKSNSSVKKISHSIRNLVLSILQIFIDDFERKDIEVSLDAGSASERRLEIDDDSLFVSLFYLLENSLKYCCPKTKYKIIFKDEGANFCILFIMISLRIENNEVANLTEYGYRSPLAQKLNKSGKGIGMNRIVKTLKLNDAVLEITPRINDYVKKVNEIQYEGNQFKIKFLGQKRILS